jgi:hypothetical protein
MQIYQWSDLADTEAEYNIPLNWTSWGDITDSDNCFINDAQRVIIRLQGWKMVMSAGVAQTTPAGRGLTSRQHTHAISDAPRLQIWTVKGRDS